MESEQPRPDARRSALVKRSLTISGHRTSVSLEDALSRIVQNRVESLPRRERAEIALWLTEAGISQRQVHELTGVSRDTIRKKTKAGNVELVNEE